MLHADISGEPGAPTLLLLHGLGVNGAAFDRLRQAVPDGWRVVAPDFAGHGLSPRETNYSLGRHAADVAALLEPGARVRILAHSMGGAVGLILATGWFGITVERVVTVGMKMSWTAEEVARMGQPFPVRGFDTREAAAERFLKVTGLIGVAGPDERVVERGLTEEDGRWRLASDPETVRVVGPETPALIAGAKTGGAAVRLACGSRDPLVKPEELPSFDADAVVLDGGHNLHMERPAELARLIL